MMTKFVSKAQAQKLTGIDYLGSVSKTVKHIKSIKFGELTYALYLAPGNLSGYEVCRGRTVECTKYCLNESGHNCRHASPQNEFINNARIKKTKLFFEDREFFMEWMISEINSAILKAKKMEYKFSIRINNTSDINPEDFYIIKNNIKVNLLQLYPEVQFYDYTKLYDRLPLTEKYPNYNLTFSYTGFNIQECLSALEKGYKVAVVFKNPPQSFLGYPVINGDINDLRYREKNPAIVGLKYKTTRTKLTPDVKFVVQ